MNKVWNSLVRMVKLFKFKMQLIILIIYQKCIKNIVQLKKEDAQAKFKQEII